MLRVCNHYTRTIWVTIMWYSPNCGDGGNWRKRGWWKIDPGQCKIVFGEDLEDINRYFCYYANSSDGSEWSGPYIRDVPINAFLWCEWSKDSQSREIGYRLLDIEDNDDFTLNLVA